MSSRIPVRHHPAKRLGAGTMHPRLARETEPLDFAEGTLHTGPSLDEETRADIQKGRDLLEKGKCQAAFRLLDELTTKNPRVLEFQVLRSYAIGCLRQLAGDESEAAHHYRRTLAMDPYFEPAREKLNGLSRKNESFLSRLFHK